MAENAKPRIVRVGRYDLHAKIASGGMAAVHIGRFAGPVGSNRTVAIKRLHPAFAAEPELVVSMLIDEAHLAARIRHANVVQDARYRDRRRRSVRRHGGCAGRVAGRARLASDEDPRADHRRDCIGARRGSAPATVPDASAVPADSRTMAHAPELRCLHPAGRIGKRDAIPQATQLRGCARYFDKKTNRILDERECLPHGTGNPHP